MKKIFSSIVLALLVAANAHAGKGYTNDTAPATCVDGDFWIDTNGTSGERLYVCEEGSWVKHVGYGTAASPSFNSVHASGGNLAAANKQVTKAWQTGLSYTADETSVIHGGQHYICSSTHTAGSTTEPGVGADWETVWTVASGERPWVIQSTAPADTTLIWFDDDQVAGYLVLKVHNGTSWVQQAISEGGSMVYPGAGVPKSTGSAWDTSYTVGTAANNLVQLNAYGQLPAVSGVNITDTFTDPLIAAQTTHKGALETIAAEVSNMPSISTASAGIVQVNSSNEIVVDDDVVAASYGTTAADGSRRSVIPTNTTISPLADGSEEFYNEGGQLKVVEANTEYDLLHSGDVREYIGWAVVDSDTATTVADGKKAATIPATMNGMVLKDFTCAVSDLNSAASGDTTVVLRRVRGATAADMTSTGVTIAYGDYTASDETIDTANDDVATGDKIFVDVNAITTAAHKGLGCTATFGW